MIQNIVPRHPQKNITDDTITIRKVRELRSYTRTQVGLLLSLSGKQIEAIENGRVQLTDARIDEFCAAFKISRSQYEKIKSGKIDLRGSNEKVAPIIRIIEHKNLRRSYKKVVDRRTRAIASLRHLTGLARTPSALHAGAGARALVLLRMDRERNRKRIPTQRLGRSRQSLLIIVTAQRR